MYCKYLFNFLDLTFRTLAVQQKSEIQLFLIGRKTTVKNSLGAMENCFLSQKRQCSQSVDLGIATALISINFSSSDNYPAHVTVVVLFPISLGKISLWTKKIKEWP